MRIVKFSYGVGYGRHTDQEVFADNTPDEEIEQIIQDIVMQKLDWGFEIEDVPEEDGTE